MCSAAWPTAELERGDGDMINGHFDIDAGTVGGLRKDTVGCVEAVFNSTCLLKSSEPEVNECWLSHAHKASWHPLLCKRQGHDAAKTL